MRTSLFGMNQNLQRKLIGLGVHADATEVSVFFKEQNDLTWALHTAHSSNGVELHPEHDHPVILDQSGQEVPAALLSSFSLLDETDQTRLLYKRTDTSKISIATQQSPGVFRTDGECQGLLDPGRIVPNFRLDGNYVMYTGNEGIHLATSPDGLVWTIAERPILFPLDDKYGPMTLSAQLALSTLNGLLVIFLARGRESHGAFYSLHAAFFDPSDPARMLKRSEPLWEQGDEWLASTVSPVGVVFFQKKLISYWDFHEEGLFAITHTTLKNLTKPEVRATDLVRLTQNPLITPITAHYWESKATFNPAAITLDGKVHLLYRAIGDRDVSTMGYAVSSDAITFERLKTPAYVPREPFEGAVPQHTPRPQEEHVSPYISGGGGWGGCEDPRLTQIDDKLYLVYVAYDGWSGPRVALSSITVENFVQRVWDWAKPVLISPPGVVDKNAVIFPEKIHGKYVILHRVFPDILLDYVDSLDFDGETFLRGEHKISPTRTGWDNRKVGAGAPPIKTKDGWLLIYHSVGEADPGRYKMGAMLLDLEDPTKVLARTVRPILAPDHEHENNGWKSGVAYPCGAVVVDGSLYVYYGGADTVVCAAMANLDEFVSELKEMGTAVLTPVSIHTKHQLR